MANLLILDESDVAGRAFQGLVARGNHRSLVATTPAAAWRLLRQGVVFDLVFMEMKFTHASGVAFLQDLRADSFWRILPVVVYTTETDSRVVKRALALRVQNYLIKPFSEQQIHTEIAKAMENPWRELHFEEARSFAGVSGISVDALREKRRQVMSAYDRAAKTFPTWVDKRQNEEVFTEMSTLAGQAEHAGVWAGLDYVRHLQEQASSGNWAALADCGEYLSYASRLIHCQLNPGFLPDCMRSDAEVAAAREVAERSRWEQHEVDRAGPLVDPEALKAQVVALGGCPVVDSSVAALQMVAEGRASNMGQVMDVVTSDPGLAVQILAAANRCHHDELAPIEDVRGGASMLGELKIIALINSMPLALSRHANQAPFSWAGYWMYQVAVGRVARFICSYLEFEYLSGTAYTAGLIHDVGRLFLLKLQPFAFQAVVRYARERRVSVAEAEMKYLGRTTRDFAIWYAETGALPPVYANVLRHIDTPDQAEANADLIAMVSLARHICAHARIGAPADPWLAASAPLTATAAWRVLQPRLFPSFDAKKFELQAHAYCLTLRAELSGSRIAHRPTHAERAAELV